MSSCRGSVRRRPTGGTASSTTSSGTSRISSTPEGLHRGNRRRAASAFGRIPGIVRIVHPFPSALDAAITAILAGLAGGRPSTALILGAAMFAIQAGIGATNDLLDVAADRRTKPWKPLPIGSVTPATARMIALAAFPTGILLAASVSLGAAFVGAVGAAIGLAYDLRLRGTVASWLPFALGIPLVPVFAWLGAIGSLPAAVVVAAVIAVPSGAAISIANALPDVERDLLAETRSVATQLGLASAARLDAVLQAIVGGSALLAMVAMGGARVPPPAWAGILLAASALAVGVVLSHGGRVESRQRGWEMQALATGLLAASWFGGIVGAGRL